MLACPKCGEANPDLARFCLNCGMAMTAAAGEDAGHETRRRVTILFSDVAGSTGMGEQLDPEALRQVMQRYFDAMRVAVERHEGTVEKFIGDAVMAVFGIPQLHEDDALRAVRAVMDMRTALGTLNRDLASRWGVELAIRTGVNTGEVVAGDAATHQTLATGDVVNTAARLEQAAQPGEILIGAETERLVRHAVTTEPVEPLKLKGKADPVRAWRLLSVDPLAQAASRRIDSPMVGRDRQLRMLTDAAERARDDRTPQLVTVLGLAGVGKSRLVHEFLGKVRGDAMVIRGRCLSYGDAITYWPLVEALRGAAGIEPGDPPEKAVERLKALAEGVAQSQVVAERVAAAIGLAPADTVAGGGQETFWAVRRLLEAMARRQPLVAVFDDVQWGTPTFLDLLEHITDWSREAPILLLAIARPELLEARPTWGGGKMNAATLLLEPLDEASVSEMLLYLTGGSALPDELARRIEEAAEGNPLFVEELLSMLVDDGTLERDGDAYRVTRVPAQIAVPPTIEMLLAARLDHLPAEERAVLGRAAVVGKRFGASAVAQLSPEAERSTVLPRLMALVRKELVRLDETSAAEADTLDEEVRFRFRHQLVRDAAYESLPKQERAHLHERYARWLEELPAERLRQLDEIVGYHLEQAHRLWTALGGQPGTPDTASRAAAHLAAAGLRAYDRGDYAAAANLLARAARLLPAADPQRIALLPQLARALIELGRFDDGQALLNEAIEATADGSDPAARVRALVGRARLALNKGATAAEQMPDIQEALAIAQATGDLVQLARVHSNLAVVVAGTGRLGEARREAELAVDAAQRSGDPSLEAAVRSGLAQVVCWGTSPAADIHWILAENIAFARKHGDRYMEGEVLMAQAIEEARGGGIPEARRLLAEYLAIFEDLAALLWIAGTSRERGWVEFLAGDPDVRERVLREGFEQLSAMGERGYLSTIAADLADALLDLGRLDEADAMCAVAEEAGAQDDVSTQVAVRLVRGRLAAARGGMDQALTLAASALALADEGEYYELLTGSRLVFAQLLLEAGRMDEARVRAQEVIDLARPRGDVVFEGRAKHLIERAALSSPTPS